jgi:hypothetical protein
MKRLINCDVSEYHGYRLAYREGEEVEVLSVSLNESFDSGVSVLIETKEGKTDHVCASLLSAKHSKSCE